MSASIGSQWARGAASALAIGLIGAGVVVFGVLARSTPPERTAGPGVDPLVVEVAPVRWEDGHEIERSFVGRVEARRESDLGFELGGMLARVAVEEGQRVAEGDVVAALDDARLRARRAELVAARDEARARFELAELRLGRVGEARDRAAASEREWDDAEKQHSAARASLARAQAELESVDVDLAKTVIVSPFDAVVGRRFADAGRVIDAGEPVVRLLERSAPEARIGVAGPAIRSITPGLEVVVEIGQRRVPGAVAAVLPTRDRGARAVDAIVRLDAELDGIRSGDLARLSIQRRVEERGFWAPTQSLTEGTRGLWSVYVIRDDGGREAILARADVEVLHAEADRAFVRGALNEGDRFVARGLHRVAPGMVVQPEDRAASLAAHDGSR